MIIDFRYHVVTLVAIFLALGLGIIIGTNLGKTVNLQLEKQIDRLEMTYDKIREDQRLLRTSLQLKEDELAIANQFQKAILPQIISNKLSGKRVAIIRTNNSIDFKYAQNLANILKLAGAEVATITTFNSALNLADPQFKSELINSLDLTELPEKELLTQIYQKIILAIVTGENNPSLQYLQSKTFLQLSGNYQLGFADTLIFLGGGMSSNSNLQKELDVPLLDAARKTQATVIGVEPSFIPESYMRLYQSRCKSTIDNIETTPGQVSLIYLLFSGKTGHYGLKETARELMPTIKFN